jgi:hypothetical protein
MRVNLIKNRKKHCKQLNLNIFILKGLFYSIYNYAENHRK